MSEQETIEVKIGDTYVLRVKKSKWTGECTASYYVALEDVLVRIMHWYIEADLGKVVVYHKDNETMYEWDFNE